jgi:nitrogen fixation protein NifX
VLKIAFATGDGNAVDQHFGWCRRFDIYEVSVDAARLLESRILPPAPEDEADKIASRLDQVRDCAILNICDIGGSAAAKVVNAKIHPVKVASGTPVEELIGRLQAVLAGTPPPWLRKVLRQHGPNADLAWSPAGGAR